MNTSMSMAAIREIWDSWREGDTIEAIAAKVGHDHRTVFDVAMQLAEVTPEIEGKIIAARSGGMKLSEIRQEFGVGYHAARYFCDGVKRRRKSHREKQSFAEAWDEAIRILRGETWSH